MLKQLIIGEKLIPIKFHGQVKHLILECNCCHKQFIKAESYVRKQSKKRQFACCFCSPTCRSKFLYKGNHPKKEAQPVAQTSTPAPIPQIKTIPKNKNPSVVVSNKKEGAFSNFLRNFFG